jgi:hypothetical protein
MYVCMHTNNANEKGSTAVLGTSSVLVSLSVRAWPRKLSCSLPNTLAWSLKPTRANECKRTNPPTYPLPLTHQTMIACSSFGIISRSPRFVCLPPHRPSCYLFPPERELPRELPRERSSNVAGKFQDPCNPGVWIRHTNWNNPSVTTGSKGV